MNPVPVIRGPYRRKTGRKPTHRIRGVERRWRAGKLDGRYRETMQIEALADDFAADAGGWPNLSNREVALVHVAAFAAWACQQSAAWAISRRQIIDDNGTMPSVLAKNFVSYANVLSRTLERLGLRPDEGKQELTLQQYLEQRGSASNTPERASHAQDAATSEVQAETAAGGNGRATAPESAAEEEPQS